MMIRGGGEAKTEITSLVERQRNKPTINHQILLNIDPTQKYLSELAERFKIHKISIRHFTIPDSNSLLKQQVNRNKKALHREDFVYMFVRKRF